MDAAGADLTALEMVSRLEKPMNRSEHRNARAKQKGSASGEADSESQKKSRKEKKKEKKKRELSRGGSSRSGRRHFSWGWSNSAEG